MKNNVFFSSLLVSAWSVASVASAFANDCLAWSSKNRVPVVELYTSEGCSSCPPADRWLIKQVNRYSDSEAIFISLHVPYWDYIGWKDRFAKPEIEARQRLLARLNRTNVYTPQVFVSGMDSRLRGGGGRHVSRQLEQIGSQESVIKLGITKVSDGKYELVWGNAPDLPLQGYVVITSDSEISNVLAGENTHVKLEHANVARWWSSALIVSEPDGRFIINTPSFDKDFSQGKVVFVVSNTKRHILQAVALNKDCSHNND